MAKFYPSFEEIQQLRTPPTAGELALLTFLKQYLKGWDDYEIYFQSNIEGWRPDVVIMRRGGGVMIIEVKDYDMSLYHIDNDENWYVITPQAKEERINSPMEQVCEYKNILYDLFVPELLVQKTLNTKLYALVTCGIFLYKAQKKDIDYVKRQCPTFSKVLQNSVFSANDLNDNYFDEMFKRTWLSRASRYFTDELYHSFQSVFQPTEHTSNSHREYNIVFTDKKKKMLSVSRPGKQKIRGVAGSGKTAVLAKRAYDAYLRTGSTVIILTFNITLRNYIRDKISAFLPADMKHRGRFLREHFKIWHYHAFLRWYKDMYIPDDDLLTDINNYVIPPEYITVKFDAIFVDEAQDYEKKWVECIHKLLKKDGELVFFADEKQAIYGRSLLKEDGKKLCAYTGIPGQWNELVEHTHRMNEEIAELANKYQQEFLVKYDYEPLKPVQIELFREETIIRYSFMPEFTPEEIIKVLDDFLMEKSPHRNDVCFLSSEIEYLHELDALYRSKGWKTTRTFEKKEVYEKLRCKIGKWFAGEIYTEGDLKKDLREIRRSYKMSFNLESGMMKFSTVQSFKGWEIQTVFLIIGPERIGPKAKEETSVRTLHNFSPCINKKEQEGNGKISRIKREELIYTGITRAKQNLFVFNIGDTVLDQFFKKALNLKA